MTQKAALMVYKHGHRLLTYSLDASQSSSSLVRVLLTDRPQAQAENQAEMSTQTQLTMVFKIPEHSMLAILCTLYSVEQVGTEYRLQ